MNRSRGTTLTVLVTALLLVLARPALAHELLGPGSRGPEVAVWQGQLNAVRDPDIDVDGVYGPVTTAATRDFQGHRRIRVDGVVGPQTRQAMREALREDPQAPDPGEATPITDVALVQSAGYLDRGDRGEAVAALQRLLNTQRQSPLAVDGIFGRRTEAAVRDFQRSQDIAVDGIVGPQTVGAFEEALDIRVPEPQTGPRTAQPSPDAALSVTGVRTGVHAGYERIVFDLAGTGTPGWHVEQVDTVQQQGSGREVELAGNTNLQVHIRGTVIPPEAPEPYYSGPDTVQPEATSNVQEIYMGTWFEGVYDAGIGLDSAESFNVFALTEPTPRLVIDVLTGD